MSGRLDRDELRILLIMQWCSGIASVGVFIAEEVLGRGETGYWGTYMALCVLFHAVRKIGRG